MNPFVSVAAPLSFVTTTSTFAQGVPVGVSHVMVVSFTTTTLVAEAPSMVTVFVPGELFWKPVPVSVTLVAPSEVPLEDATDVKVGRGK